MAHPLYDVWKDEQDVLGKTGGYPWRVQLENYIAYFMTEEQARRYVDAVKAERKKRGLK